MIAVAQAVDVAGHRHELSAMPDGEAEARRVAARAAALLGRIGSPGQWSGGRLVVTDATDGRLVAVARVRVPARS